MTQPSGHPARWYPDPLGRHEHRYYDGFRWTEHVADRGRQGVDPLPAPAGDRGGSAPGGGTVFTEPVLLVARVPRLTEAAREYRVADQQGRPLSVVRERVADGRGRRAIRFIADTDQVRAHAVDVADQSGRVVLTLSRHAGLGSVRVTVGDGSGGEVGRISRPAGRSGLVLEAGGRRVGSVVRRADGAVVEDESGREVAWVHERPEHSAVRFREPLPEPFGTLAVAAVLGLHTILARDPQALTTGTTFGSRSGATAG